MKPKSSPPHIYMLSPLHFQSQGWKFDLVVGHLPICFQAMGLVCNFTKQATNFHFLELCQMGVRCRGPQFSWPLEALVEHCWAMLGKRIRMKFSTNSSPPCNVYRIEGMAPLEITPSLIPIMDSLVPPCSARRKCCSGVSFNTQSVRWIPGLNSQSFLFSAFQYNITLKVYLSYYKISIYIDYIRVYTHTHIHIHICIYNLFSEFS